MRLNLKCQSQSHSIVNSQRRLNEVGIDGNSVETHFSLHSIARPGGVPNKNLCIKNYDFQILYNMILCLFPRNILMSGILWDTLYPLSHQLSGISSSWIPELNTLAPSSPLSIILHLRSWFPTPLARTCEKKSNIGWKPSSPGPDTICRDHAVSTWN